MHMSDFIVIVIDGIVGSGKTTLIEKCLVPLLSERGLKITVVREPVEKWQNDGLLERFYQDQRRWGYHFQTKAFHDRVLECIEKFEKYGTYTDVFLLERSIFSDSLFMKMLHEDKVVDDVEMKHYTEWWSLWSRLMPFEPDLFVYLKPDLNVAMGRVKERSRGGEDGISVEYQHRLQQKHDEFLGGDTVSISESHYVPCFHMATNSNFRDDPDVKNQIATVFENKIKNILKAKSKK